MTEDEAKSQVAKENNIPPKWFCPLIGDKCNVSCLCYRRAWFRDNETDTDYVIEHNKCNNGMFQWK